MPITRLYDFTTGTVANPDEVDAELNQIISLVNSLEATMMPRSGGTFTGAITFNTNVSFAAGTLTLFADPSSAMHAASKQYVDAQVATRFPLAGGATITGDLYMKYALPTLYMRADGAEDLADWAIQAVNDATGRILIYYNTGTIAAPIWTLRYCFSPSGSADINEDIVRRVYLDGRIVIALGRVEKADGDFNTSSTTFVDVTGMSANITMNGARYLRVYVQGHVRNGSGSPKTISLNIQVDGNNIGGTDGVWQQDVNSGDTVPVSIIMRTPTTLAAAAHTVKLQIKGSAGINTIFKTSGTLGANIYLEEILNV